MSAPGRLVVLPGPDGLWFLGREAGLGVQMDIENFASLAQARIWCANNNARALIYLGRHRVSLEKMRRLDEIDAGGGPKSMRGVRALISSGIVRKTGRGKAATYEIHDPEVREAVAKAKGRS